MRAEPTTAELIAVALASPAAVARHDERAWVGLFAPDAVVNDPVGSRPHVGTAAIERFYAAFIAPNTIEFDVRHDLVVDHSVWRDLDIVITMSTGAAVRVPMVLCYDLVLIGSDWRIARLAAYWELAPMTRALLRTGWPGVRAGARLGLRLTTTLGPLGALGMGRALFGVGARGIGVVRRLADASEPADRRRWFADGAVAVTTETGPDTATARTRQLPLDEFLTLSANLRWEQPRAAGRTVTATVGDDDRAGIAVVEFGARSTLITRAALLLGPRPAIG